MLLKLPIPDLGSVFWWINIITTSSFTEIPLMEDDP